MYLVSLLFLLTFSFCAAVSDVMTRRIPNQITAAIFFLNAGTFCIDIFLFSSEPLLSGKGLLSAFVITLPLFLISYMYRQIAGRPAFGGGDLKLLFVTFLFFDLHHAFRIFFLSLFFGAAAGVFLKVFRKELRMPFAPAVFDATLAVVLSVLFAQG